MTFPGARDGNSPKETVDASDMLRDIPFAPRSSCGLAGLWFCGSWPMPTSSARSPPGAEGTPCGCRGWHPSSPQASSNQPLSHLPWAHLTSFRICGGDSFGSVFHCFHCFLLQANNLSRAVLRLQGRGPTHTSTPPATKMPLPCQCLWGATRTPGIQVQT